MSEKILGVRQLFGEIFRHPLAVCLVLGVHAVAERTSRQIEGHSHIIGLLVLDLLEEYRHESVDGIGMFPVLCGQVLDAVERAVEYAVAVDKKDLAHVLFFFPLFFPSALGKMSASSGRNTASIAYPRAAPIVFVMMSVMSKQRSA